MEYKIITWKQFNTDGEPYWSARFDNNKWLVGGGSSEQEAITELLENNKVLQEYYEERNKINIDEIIEKCKEQYNIEITNKAKSITNEQWIDTLSEKEAKDLLKSEYVTSCDMCCYKSYKEKYGNCDGCSCHIGKSLWLEHKHEVQK